MLSPVVSVTNDVLMRIQQMLLSILEACVRALSTNSSPAELQRELCPGADGDDEVDLDMRAEEEITEPAAAADVPTGAAAEVPRVVVPAAAADELTTGQRQDIDNWPSNLRRQY